MGNYGILKLLLMSVCSISYVEGGAVWAEQSCFMLPPPEDQISFRQVPSLSPRRSRERSDRDETNPPTISTLSDECHKYKA